MGQEIRNYRFTYAVPSEGHPIDPETNLPVMTKLQEVIQAYDLQEAMMQFHIKFGTVAVTEVIPFKYIEETAPVVENKKEVHVKPNPARK